MTLRRTVQVAAVLFALAVTCNAQGKNLLFYGNSYSSRNGTVANLVQLLAMQAGHASPTIVKRFQNSEDLAYHASNAGQVAAIANSLPTGQTWDFVVMQGQSTEATQVLGDPTLFRGSAALIVNNVRNHSPAARAVLYQTWARALGHHYYPNTFATPISMHNEIRNNYRLATSDINTQFGAGTARNAAVGDGVALLEWNPAFYNLDLFHPLEAMTLLASMCLYTSIYEQRVCGIAVNFAASSPLVNWLTSLGLNENDWHAMAALADRSAAPSLRAFPGSSDHLLLESGTLPGRVDACGHINIGLGSLLALRMRSMNGVFNASSGMLLVNIFPTGLPPTPSLTWPELHIDTGSMLVLTTVGSLSMPHNVIAPLPFTFPGASVMVQGLAWGASSETGNIHFTTTDAHILDFQ